MLNLLRKKNQAKIDPALLGLRAQLFAMDDLTSLVRNLDVEGREMLPGSLLFISAEQALQAGEKSAAIAILQEIIAAPGVNSRAALYALYNLRLLGTRAPTGHKPQIFGMVLETPLPNGREILAGYADHCAYYYIFPGSSLSSIGQDAKQGIKIAAAIDALLISGEPILLRAQVWEKPEPGPPPPGFARISILTDLGLYFGQGPEKLLARQSLAGPPLKAGNFLKSVLKEMPS